MDLQYIWDTSKHNAEDFDSHIGTNGESMGLVAVSAEVAIDVLKREYDILDQRDYNNGDGIKLLVRRKSNIPELRFVACIAVFKAVLYR